MQIVGGTKVSTSKMHEFLLKHTVTEQENCMTI